MEKEGLGFRDFFVYVIPGGLYLLSGLAWFPDLIKKVSEQHVALASLGLVIVAYSIGFAGYWISYLLRHVLPGWKEETKQIIRMIIYVMKEMPEFYKDEIFRYRNLCRVCLSLSVPSGAMGLSWGLVLWPNYHRLAIAILVVTVVIIVSLLYRAVRYNKRYLLQIEIAYEEIQEIQEIQKKENPHNNTPEPIAAKRAEGTV